MVDIADIMICFNTALDMLYQEQSDLIRRDVHERSIVFWFGVYFREVLLQHDYKIGVQADFNLDVEYNRNGAHPKMWGEHDESNAYLDLILHTRETNENNLLIVEFKKPRNNRWNAEDKDIQKLKFFTSDREQYKYQLGVFVKLGECRNTVRLQYFENGEEVNINE